MLLLPAQGPHLENQCSRAPLRISDKWALPSHRWENRSLREVGPPAVTLSLKLKSQPSPLAVLCDLAQFGWDCGLREEDRKKTLSVCLLLTPMASPLLSDASCHLGSFVPISSSLPIVGKEMPLCSLKLTLQLSAMGYQAAVQITNLISMW